MPPRDAQSRMRRSKLKLGGPLFYAASATLAAIGCSVGSPSSNKDDSVAGSGGNAAPSSGGTLSGSSGGAPELGGDDLITAGSPLNQGGNDGLTTCESSSAKTELAPVYLALAFDVSGSMGELDRPRWWHDPEAKWKPIASATRAFLEDPSVKRMNASMVLFPAEDDECDPETYTTPTVPMTPLPSALFGAALDDYEEEVGSELAGGDWRGGTPTFAALMGAGASLDAVRVAHPEAAFAVVLITDGLPQSCDEGLEETLGAAEELQSQGLPTYVIGIQNPTVPPSELPEGWSDWGECEDDAGTSETPCPPPGNLDALNELSRAGGTDSAFLIDTQDPEATKDAFLTAIESIRTRTSSCTLAVPPDPNGGTFKPDQIDVNVKLNGATEKLTYDETCSQTNGWRFADLDGSPVVELCASTCERVTTADDAELTVEFLCEPRWE
jgi:hypothetical protein